MSNDYMSAAKLLRLEEQIRQEQETFNLRKSHEEQWFNLRLRMGYIAALLLPLILIICSLIIYHHSLFPAEIVTLASTGLLVDILGFMVAVWKLVLNPSSIIKTEPISTGFDKLSADE